MYTRLEPTQLWEFVEGRGAEIGVTLEEVIQGYDPPYELWGTLHVRGHMGCREQPMGYVSEKLQLPKEYLEEVQSIYLAYKRAKYMLPAPNWRLPTKGGTREMRGERIRVED